MPTSASTGTEQIETKAPKSAKATDDTVANTTAQPDPKERNTPDGAPVVTKAEDVVGGVRVDLPPSAPAGPDAVDISLHQGGTAQVARPDGTFVNLDTDDPDFEEHAEKIRSGEVNH